MPIRQSEAEYQRSYYKKNRTKIRRKQKAYYRKTASHHIDRQGRRYWRDPSKRWAYMLQYKFNITVEEYELRLRKQKGLCAICKEKPSGRFKRLAVDHCHKTKRIRGLLCVSCNRAIGWLRDSPRLLKRAAAYLLGGT